MPTLQVRDLPEEIYQQLSLLAEAEHRSITQQTIVLLRESLGMYRGNKLRRSAVLRNLNKRNYPQNPSLDVVALIREDRER